MHVAFDRRTNLLLSSDVSDQRGTPLTFNKVMAVKPGFQVDNPADLHEVRTSVLGRQHQQQYGATARLTTGLTLSTNVVSLTAFRRLDYSFSLDSDITELEISTFDQHESPHQLSEEITVSHQQARLTWVAGMFLFSEADDQSFLSPQKPASVEIRVHPGVDATSHAVFGQATIGLTSALSATLGLRYTHEQKDIETPGPVPPQ
jgi:iron complex outermembrane receptor protein